MTEGETSVFDRTEILHYVSSDLADRHKLHMQFLYSIFSIRKGRICPNTYFISCKVLNSIDTEGYRDAHFTFLCCLENFVAEEPEKRGDDFLCFSGK